MKKAGVTTFLETENPVLDVRSPSEFRKGHIPGALSLPLFSDEERAEVGTLYKQSSRQEAIKKGLEIVGPKMRGFIEACEAIGGSTFNLYCWRGGMRSDSMAWLLERYGFEVSLLEGGYKAYRNAMMQDFAIPLHLKMLTGFTGSGKTDVLQAMQELGVQIIDLEGLAQHQGSSFGNQLTTGQPTTEMFQNQLHAALSALDRQKEICSCEMKMKLAIFLNSR